ncbi:MAG TPA: alpha,alpha-trehalose-phosphate synthase (UDP-forming) [Stellaceae bacterium]|nr:alpha,alpha-trehalose-phosphate synthase (UDP-forming) [Stellaceae bacterium]
MPRSTPANLMTLTAARHATAAGAPERRLVVVSNRVAMADPAAKAAGGLAVGILAALKRSGGIWFGWSGEVTETPPEAAEVALRDDITYATLDLARRDYEQYYNGFANRVLWPLFHYRPDLIDFQREDFAGYLRVNRQFALQLRPLLKADDMIWVHDYHLMPLADELRRLGVEQPIGFFLHTPFPAAEVLRILPTHGMLMRAMCAYDLVGFQTENDAWSFREYLLRCAGGRAEGVDGIDAFGRQLRAAAFPIGIDVDAIVRQAAQSVGGRHMKRLQDSLRQRRLIIGVDRLDYSKGLLQRFKAFERLIEMFPETRGHVTLMQVAPPTRSEVPEYNQIRRSLETAAGHINGRFAEFDWMPVRYLNKSFNHRTLCGFLRAARVGLVTPLRDGMNLVAKEYVAAQDPEDPGMLVLSCFAGSARELGDALIVNPYDIDGVAEAIEEALGMPQEERIERWQAMMAVLRRNDIVAWRENFTTALAEAAAGR